MDSNLSSDSHHIESPFFLQGSHSTDGSAHKHQGALTLNPFPRARVESLGLPLCSEFPRIPGSKASLGLGLGPTRDPTPACLLQFPRPVTASWPVLSWRTHSSATSSAFPREKGQTLREWTQESVTCRCSVASVPRDSQIKSTLLYQQEKLSFFLSPTLLVLLTPLGNASKSTVQVPPWPFLVSATGNLKFLETQREGGGKREAPRSGPQSSNSSCQEEGLPARQRLRIQEQGQIATSGKGGVWLKGGE